MTNKNVKWYLNKLKNIIKRSYNEENKEEVK
jgi:hypothetical protein